MPELRGDAPRDPRCPTCGSLSSGPCCGEVEPWLYDPPPEHVFKGGSYRVAPEVEIRKRGAARYPNEDHESLHMRLHWEYRKAQFKWMLEPIMGAIFIAGVVWTAIALAVLAGSCLERVG